MTLFLRMEHLQDLTVKSGHGIFGFHERLVLPSLASYAYYSEGAIYASL